MTQEHHELQERLKEEKNQKEQFKNTKNEIEDERRLLDRTVEKLQREVRTSSDNMLFFLIMLSLSFLSLHAFEFTEKHNIICVTETWAESDK